MATVRWTLAAIKDLDDIADYVAKDSPSRAYSLALALYEAPRRLEQFLLAGERLRQYQGEVHQILKHGYRIVYQVSGDICRIVAIIHASRDLDAAILGRIIAEP